QRALQVYNADPRTEAVLNSLMLGFKNVNQAIAVLEGNDNSDELFRKMLTNLLRATTEAIYRAYQATHGGKDLDKFRLKMEAEGRKIDINKIIKDTQESEAIRMKG
ncbi:MAG: hypothetical protein KGL39_55540, partial [Patescibacteria group bacterium]|nr:hypothetical protein [Patescibacteria group bacterium]